MVKGKKTGDIEIRRQNKMLARMVEVLSEQRTCSYIPVSSLVPDRNARAQICGLLSEDAPFSWGDNNLSLVTATRLAEHCEDRLGDSAHELNLISLLGCLGETYIDLES